jgi:hypothetical protein
MRRELEPSAQQGRLQMNALGAPWQVMGDLDME